MWRAWTAFQTTKTAVPGFISGYSRAALTVANLFYRQEKTADSTINQKHIQRNTLRPISLYTVAKRFRKEGLFARWFVRCALSTPAHPRHCFQCCQQHKCCVDPQWGRVHFTGSPFCLPSDSWHIQMWREMWNTRLLFSYHRNRRAGVFVSGSMIFGSYIDIHTFYGDAISIVWYCT